MEAAIVKIERPGSSQVLISIFRVLLWGAPIITTTVVFIDYTPSNMTAIAWEKISSHIKQSQRLASAFFFFSKRSRVS